MAIRGRLQPIDVELKVMFDAQLSPEARSRMLADEARRQFARADEINRQALGVEPSSVTTVDGVAGVPLEQVRPDGVLMRVYDLQNEVVDWCWMQILTHSPVKSGAYRRSHHLFADGMEVEGPEPALVAEEWLITTTSVYARKIEGDKTKGREPQSAQAPEGVYHAVEELGKRRFGNSAEIRFEYVSLAAGGAIADWAEKRRRPGRAGQRQFLKDTRQPALRISFR